MKLIQQSAIYLPQEPGLEGIYKQIELAARTCYKSEDKITEDSAEKMVKSLINSGHTAMLEHGTVYLRYPDWDTACNYDYAKFDFQNSYADGLFDNDSGKLYITTNYRALLENAWEEDLVFLAPPNEFHPKRYTVRCITNLQVSHELVRHRSMSFAMESSRYCNYSKDKFNNELTFIEPCWLEHSISGEEIPDEDTWYAAMSSIEKSYFKLLDYGWKPQQAAQVLPKATKTEVVITAFEKDWKHFFDLRLLEKTGPVHPQMKELAQKIAFALGYNPDTQTFSPKIV